MQALSLLYLWIRFDTLFKCCLMLRICPLRRLYAKQTLGYADFGPHAVRKAVRICVTAALEVAAGFDAAVTVGVAGAPQQRLLHGDAEIGLPHVRIHVVPALAVLAAPEVAHWHLDQRM